MERTHGRGARDERGDSPIPGDPAPRLRFSDTSGDGATVIALHGWPGDRHDWDAVAEALTPLARVVSPDLYGFGDTGWDENGRDSAYTADGQAALVIELIESLALTEVVLTGYDIGSRVAQRVAATRPDLVRALVIGPPIPGAGARVLASERKGSFWYQDLHRLPLAGRLIDGSTYATREYLSHFWTAWSGPGFSPDDARLDRLVDSYARPGAFTASIGWYRVGAGTVAASLRESPPGRLDRIAVPTTVLWPEADPLFPTDWSDRIDDWFADARLRTVTGGHFLPLEATADVASTIASHVVAHPDRETPER